MKRNDGFTLIELLVTVSAGALVTFAAISLLLLGARVQYRTTQEAQEQQTVRVAMTMLEKMAGSGEFNAIETTYSGWKLLNITEKTEAGQVVSVKKPVFEYVNTEQTIYRGAYHSDGQNNEPVLTGLTNAGVAMEGNLLRLSFETTQGGSYVTRVYCRTVDISETKDSTVQNAGVLSEEGKKEIPGATNRINFLDKLAGEYNDGRNTGWIIGTNRYYSEWYLNYLYNSGYNANPGWNKDTPWCACFVSWAAANNGLANKEDPATKAFIFADVDAGMKAFKQADGDRWEDADGSYIPIPGDYIFFDWTGQQKDPAHVGVVLDVQPNTTNPEFVYTIEGNSSGRVAVRKYSVADEDIMGYGILPGFEPSAP